MIDDREAVVERAAVAVNAALISVLMSPTATDRQAVLRERDTAAALAVIAVLESEGWVAPE